MKIEVSNGEILDKYSILDIKLSRIEDESKLENIQKEYEELTEMVYEIFRKVEGEALVNLYDSLLDTNKKLWDIEDLCRELERAEDFGDLFIETARSVYLTNDERSRIKKDINIITGSDIIEEKGYKEY